MQAAYGFNAWHVFCTQVLNQVRFGHLFLQFVDFTRKIRPGFLAICLFSYVVANVVILLELKFMRNLCFYALIFKDLNILGASFTTVSFAVFYFLR